MKTNYLFNEKYKKFSFGIFNKYFFLIFSLSAISSGFSIDKTYTTLDQLNIQSSLSQPISSPTPNCKFGGVMEKVSYGCIADKGSRITQLVVGFYFPNDNPKGWRRSCTGVPIGDGTWVITAAHCAAHAENGDFYTSASNLRILRGENFLKRYITPGSPEEKDFFKVKAIYISSEFAQRARCWNNCRQWRDIALLKLDIPHGVRAPTPVQLFTDKLKFPDEIWIAGYGFNQYGDIEGFLRYRNMYFYSDYNAYDHENYGEIYSVGTVPINSSSGVVDPLGIAWKFSAGGDSGGPLFIERDGKFYLLATLQGGLTNVRTGFIGRIWVNGAINPEDDNPIMVHASIRENLGLIRSIFEDKCGANTQPYSCKTSKVSNK